MVLSVYPHVAVAPPPPRTLLKLLDGEPRSLITKSIGGIVHRNIEHPKWTLWTCGGYRPKRCSLRLEILSQGTGNTSQSPSRIIRVVLNCIRSQVSLLSVVHRISDQGSIQTPFIVAREHFKFVLLKCHQRMSRAAEVIPAPQIDALKL
jgi:hypothetical protein